MAPSGERVKQILRKGFQSPWSALAAAAAVGMVVYSLATRIAGNWYIEQLNYIDSTTITMVGVLLLRGLSRLRRDADGQAASIALIGALSFIFCFEALFKLSFYTFPWRMAPGELREFIIQVGIAFTALAGFAFHKYRFSTASFVFLVVFVLGWVFWLAAGFPQLTTGRDFYAPIIPVYLTGPMVYVLNRWIKIALCMVYYFLYA
jgi:hypothetical protein